MVIADFINYNIIDNYILYCPKTGDYLITGKPHLADLSQQTKRFLLLRLFRHPPITQINQFNQIGSDNQMFR